MPWQRELPADVQRVALIVVEEAETGRRRIAERYEAASNTAKTECELVGIGQVDLAAVVEARRMQGEFPAIDTSALNGDGDEDFGVIEIVVVEEVGGAGEEVVGVERPAAKRDSDAELMFFVTLPMQRNEL